MKALIFEKFGGPEVLQYKEISTPSYGTNEILVKMKAIGLNFADIYRRRGNYHLSGNPPYILGYEGSGVVEEIGSNVTEIKVGDRISFADVPFSNAEYVVVPKDKVIPLPNEISFETAASVLLQGLTAHYLTKDSYQVNTGDTVLIHAAAGGVGQLLVQIVKFLGGKVIGLTSSLQKAEIAKNVRADYVFLYEEDWVTKILEMTDRRGVDVVYESVGSTLSSSFQATKIAGTVVFYGMAGGDPEPVDPRMLMDTSKTITGGDLWNVLTTHEERVKRSNELFHWITKGHIQVSEPAIFQLRDGKLAHELLESRKSTGKILLIP
ncbi:quinone oxidoreductase family protein [Halalkalibacter nanhaiisediminis]|uniref:NADPH2:quinone reductase n=1 Tax=Halalkalibacter nanhaiisediminis TaxID=688079 RepID=A0A562QQL1_9BACI|nr:quinone oxidoreductase [Halalkalibacter nanhaiisediminis]TWI58963.1 NADPH2:quinone reductase [Halalkalibacter nanhaiisediminis]